LEVHLHRPTTQLTRRVVIFFGGGGGCSGAWPTQTTFASPC
jgi:hypothetical protein